MNPHYTYLLIDAATLAFPFLFSFDRKVAFYKSWRHILPGMLVTAAIFIAWDIAFTSSGVWWFNRDYTLAFRLAGLPIEEWLFFIVVPYSCLFISASLHAYFPPKGNDTGWKYSLWLAGFLLLVALLNITRAYTLTACGGCAIALLAAYLLRHKNKAFRMDRFLLAYAVCLVPFLIVNGLLTGLPVVLYDDAENTGLRIGTIPAEDIFYGMLLILGNAWSMCFFRQKERPEGRR